MQGEKPACHRVDDCPAASGHGGKDRSFRHRAGRACCSPGSTVNHPIIIDPGCCISYGASSALPLDKTGRGIDGKLTPAVELLVNRRTGGQLTLNPTFRLHRLVFGGGNVQLHLPL
jgi:hypothetical protein